MKNLDAVEYFNNGCNCSQAVVMAYANELGLDEKVVEGIAVAFGGGMSKQGKTCGCLSGALMVIGLKYGVESMKKVSQRAAAYNKGGDFFKCFKEEFGATDCRELIKLDLNKKRDMEIAQKENVFGNRCAKMVGRTVELLERMLAEEE